MFSFLSLKSSIALNCPESGIHLVVALNLSYISASKIDHTLLSLYSIAESIMIVSNYSNEFKTLINVP